MVFALLWAAKRKGSQHWNAGINLGTWTAYNSIASKTLYSLAWQQLIAKPPACRMLTCRISVLNLAGRLLLLMLVSKSHMSAWSIPSISWRRALQAARS